MYVYIFFCSIIAIIKIRWSSIKIPKKGYVQNYGEEFLKSLFYLRKWENSKIRFDLYY